MIRKKFFSHLNKKTHKIQKILHSTSGETIAETLVTMIVLSLSVLMLAGAVVSSAKVTSKADNTETAFTVSDESGTAGIMTITGGAATDSATLAVTAYRTENDYTYYEPAQ